jgi:hypothetical protein
MADEFTVIAEYGVEFQAELLCGVLREHGIDAWADVMVPSDEFASVRRLIGQGVRVRVRTEDVEPARELMADLKTAAAEQAALEAEQGISEDD